MKLTIYTTATSGGYSRALETQARRVLSALYSERRVRPENILIVLVTDKEEEVQAAYQTYTQGLPTATVKVLADPKFVKEGKNYERGSQLLIAQMRTAATKEALAWNSDFCLSLDGDVLPPHNAIRCMLDMLEFDNGYYGVSFCPYPSHGGGSFLGGRGNIERQIFPDYFEDEKDIPDKLLKKRDSLRKKLESLKKPDEALVKDLRAVEKEIEQVPPKMNVFEANSKKWRRRGWFDMAYPAIGKGAIVPVDWTGFGCTLMNRDALALCDWSGYGGHGTEDLYINYHRWAANNIRMCCIPHCPCDHVVRNPDPDKRLGEFVHVRTFHDTEEEYSGHLRQQHVEWFAHTPGEKLK
jgi:hypothetical protein